MNAPPPARAWMSEKRELPAHASERPRVMSTTSRPLAGRGPRASRPRGDRPVCGCGSPRPGDARSSPHHTRKKECRCFFV